MLALVFSAALTVTAPAQLATNLPLQQQDKTVAQIDCILQQLAQPFELVSLPWLRARQEVRLNRLDGYFTAILLQEMEPFGQLSAPLYLENWYWIEHRSSISVPPPAKRLGAVRGSHQAKWFETMGLVAAAEVNTSEELVRMLNLKRVDRILMDLEVFEHTAERLGLVRQDFSVRFFRYVPLGVYFSSQFLQQRPGFLSRFNALIPSCSQTPFILSEREQRIVLDAFLPQATQLATDAKIQQALISQNATPWSPEQILQHDQRWIEEVKQGQSQLADSMLHTELSQWLAEWQQQFSGRVAEIILMDAQGRNVAISAVTSDYWQGDEIKYQQVFAQPISHLLDGVRFDASSQRFLVQLTVPVNNAQGEPLGALTLGLDVELSLQYCQRNNISPGYCIN
jgi:hypothetical protein